MKCVLMFVVVFLSLCRGVSLAVARYDMVGTVCIVEKNDNGTDRIKSELMGGVLGHLDQPVVGRILSVSIKVDNGHSRERVYQAEIEMDAWNNDNYRNLKKYIDLRLSGFSSTGSIYLMNAYVRDGGVVEFLAEDISTKYFEEVSEIPGWLGSFVSKEKLRSGRLFIFRDRDVSWILIGEVKGAFVAGFDSVNFNSRSFADVFDEAMKPFKGKLIDEAAMMSIEESIFNNWRMTWMAPYHFRLPVGW